jgi:hypothetical protein
MTDHELDERLAAAFEVAPSSDFLARVRTAVAAQPAPARWQLSWPLAVASSAIVVALGGAAAIGWLTRDSSSPPAVASAPPAVAAPPGHIASAPAVVPNTPLRAVSRARHRPLTAAQEPTAASFPTVIVSADERRGLGILIRAARAATIPPVLPMDAVSAGDPLAVPHIEIALVAVEPLPDVTRLEQGDRQQ